MNMENHLCSTYMCLFSVDYSTSFLFFSFILFPSPYFRNCADTYFWDVFSPFLYFIFWFCCAFIHVFHLLDHLVLPSLFIHSFACLSAFLFYFPSSQPSSFSQHWNTGGSHPEELEWLGAHPRFQTRSQPPLLYSFTSSQPQFTDCVAVSEHSIPGGQITLQMKIRLKKKKQKTTNQKKVLECVLPLGTCWTKECVIALSANNYYYALQFYVSIVLNCKYI